MAHMTHTQPLDIEDVRPGKLLVSPGPAVYTDLSISIMPLEEVARELDLPGLQCVMQLVDQYRLELVTGGITRQSFLTYRAEEMTRRTTHVEIGEPPKRVDVIQEGGLAIFQSFVDADWGRPTDRSIGWMPQGGFVEIDDGLGIRGVTPASLDAIGSGIWWAW